MFPREPRRFGELEAIIDQVAQSYLGSREIDNLESAALPNKRAVIQAIDHLKAVLFLGFYSTRTLTRENLRQGLAEHLYAAFTPLVEQVDRAVGYHRWMKGLGTPMPSASGEQITLDLFGYVPTLRRLLNDDVLAAYHGDPAAKSVEEIVFSYPSIEAITLHRIAHRLHHEGVPMIPRIITETAHRRTGIDIAPGAKIGERFFIDHGTGVVIGETAVIGNDVKIYQGVTLGALSVPKRDDTKKRHPTIEDKVTIYAGATILGGETIIGAGSVIGGNQWLTHSVPPGSRVFGKAKNGEGEAP